MELNEIIDDILKESYDYHEQTEEVYKRMGRVEEVRYVGFFLTLYLCMNCRPIAPSRDASSLTLLAPSFGT